MQSSLDVCVLVNVPVLSISVPLTSVSTTCTLNDTSTEPPACTSTFHDTVLLPLSNVPPVASADPCTYSVPSGTTSLTGTPVASARPSLCTLSVYVMSSPGLTGAGSPAVPDVAKAIAREMTMLAPLRPMTRSI